MADRATAVLTLLQGQFLEPEMCIKDELVYGVIESVINDISDMKETVSAFNLMNRENKQTEVKQPVSSGKIFLKVALDTTGVIGGLSDQGYTVVDTKSK